MPPRHRTQYLSRGVSAPTLVHCCCHTKITLQKSTANLGGSPNLSISRELGLPSAQNNIFIDKINPPTPSEHPSGIAAKLRSTKREPWASALTGKILSTRSFYYSYQKLQKATTQIRKRKIIYIYIYMKHRSRYHNT